MIVDFTRLAECTDYFEKGAVPVRDSSLGSITVEVELAYYDFLATDDVDTGSGDVFDANTFQCVDGFGSLVL